MSYLILIAGTLFMMATAGFTQFVILTFRNPLRQGILRSDGAAISSVLLLLTIYGLAAGAQAYGLLAVGVGPVLCGILTVAVFAGTLWLNDQLFHLRERLRRADEGLSPFGPLPGALSGAQPTGA